MFDREAFSLAVSLVIGNLVNDGLVVDIAHRTKIDLEQHTISNDRARGTAPMVDTFGIGIAKPVARRLPATRSIAIRLTCPDQFGFRPILQVLVVARIGDPTTIGAAVLRPVGGRRRQPHAGDDHQYRFVDEFHCCFLLIVVSGTGASRVGGRYAT